MLINLVSKCIQFLASFFSPTDEMYYKYAKFRGTTGPINCVAFSHSGALLASGGDDETVRIWEISTRKCLQILDDPGRRWGQITCIAWLGSLGNDELKPIAFGTGRGLLVIYRRSRIDAGMVELASNRVFEASDPVESMAFDAQKSRIAITSHHGRITVYDISRNGTMLNLWSARSDENKKVCIPRSIQFYEGGKKLLIFVLETGEMICRDVETSREDWRKVLKSGIGYASICPSAKLLLVDNLSKGFDLYDLPCSSPSYTFTIPSKKKCVKDGAFAEQASAIVCGSDHGKVYVFSTASSTPIQVLTPARKTVEVQAVATTMTSDAHFIASGSSAGISEITIWEKPIKKAKGRINENSNSKALSTILNSLLIFLILHSTSGLWMPITSEITYKTLRFMYDLFPQTSATEVWNDRPKSTEWTAHASFQHQDDEDDIYDDHDISWREIEGQYLGRLDEL